MGKVQKAVHGLGHKSIYLVLSFMEILSDDGAQAKAKAEGQ